MKRSNGGNQSAAAKRKIENVSEWDAASLEGQLAWIASAEMKRRKDDGWEEVALHEVVVTHADISWTSRAKPKRKRCARAAANSGLDIWNQRLVQSRLQACVWWNLTQLRSAQTSSQSSGERQETSLADFARFLIFKQSLAPTLFAPGE
jgi:hypothetical protein